MRSAPIRACSLAITSNAALEVRVRALVTRAEIYRNKGQFDLALADCAEAIRLDPSSAEAFDGHGNALSADKKYLPALDDFDRAIKLAPTYGRAFSDRAKTFGEMRETRLAVRDYTEALRLQPDNLQALTDRAEAYLKVKRIDLAIDDFYRSDPARSGIFRLLRPARIDVLAQQCL